MKLSQQEFTHIFAALEERSEAQGERRKHARMTVTGRVRVVDVSTRHEFGAITRNISFTGLSLIQTQELMPSLGTNLVVSLPHKKDRPYRVQCKVIAARPIVDGLCCIGCEFVAFDKEAGSA